MPLVGLIIIAATWKVLCDFAESSVNVKARYYMLTRFGYKADFIKKAVVEILVLYVVLFLMNLAGILSLRIIGCSAFCLTYAFCLYCVIEYPKRSFYCRFKGDNCFIYHIIVSWYVQLLVSFAGFITGPSELGPLFALYCLHCCLILGVVADMEKNVSQSISECFFVR